MIPGALGTQGWGQFQPTMCFSSCVCVFNSSSLRSCHCHADQYYTVGHSNKQVTPCLAEKMFSKYLQSVIAVISEFGTGGHEEQTVMELVSNNHLPFYRHSREVILNLPNAVTLSHSFSCHDDPPHRKTTSLLLYNCNSAAVMNCHIHHLKCRISVLNPGRGVFDAQVENRRSTGFPLPGSTLRTAAFPLPGASCSLASEVDAFPTRCLKPRK